jgi:hypothetical protein
MRGHRVRSKQLSERKAFSAGVQALRVKLLETFKAIGRGEMSGYTAAEYVSNCKVDVPRDVPRETLRNHAGAQL